jgi:raffinose/stachyose/melibiose transport system substrate-binding protein
MLRKLFNLTSLLLIMALLLTSCTALSGGAGATAVPTESPEVTVTWWHINTEEKGKALFQAYADEYMADHPNVTIEVTVLENEAFKSKMTTVMQSGTPPDLATSWGGGVLREYAKADMLRDITPELQGEWMDSYGKGAIEIFGLDGKYYGVPNDLGMVGFWYNKALFEEAGIDAPPATWSEFLEDVKKLQAADITPIAVAGKDKWPAMYYWTYLAVRIGGKEAFDAAYTRTGKFTDEPFIEAGNKLQELVNLEPFQDGFLGATYNDEAGQVGNGKAAMELMGQWAPIVQKDQSTSKEGLGDDLGWFPFPAVEGGKGDPADAMGGGGGWIVGKNAPDEAVDFLKYFNNLENTVRNADLGGIIPVVKGSDDAIKDPFQLQIKQTVEKAPYFQLYYDQFLPPATASVVNDSIQGLFAGTSTPEEVAQLIEDSAAVELK